jgi:drug/metabolite transporter (DMT)-like permease
LGELAALATSFLWSVTSIQFTLAGRRIGAAAVNRFRLIVATMLLSLTHLALQGELLPLDAESSRWAWFGLSGLVGLVLGDGALFRALVLIGPRRSMLVMTLVPVISTIVAWVWLGETLQPIEVAAALVTIGGTAWVVSERPGDGSRSQTVTSVRGYALGILCALGGASGQALGLVLASQGLSGGFAPLSATLMRMVVATIGIWLLALVGGQARGGGRALQDRRTWLPLFGGAATGPFLGVWCSMLAVQNAPVGIASTLMSLSPILLIPLERLVFGEKTGGRAIVGTVAALIGATVIVAT